MKCHEIQTLVGPYLDSELDVRASAEVQEHLTACAACARAFAIEEKERAQLFAALREGQANPALWEQTEQLVRETARARDPSATLASRSEDTPVIHAAPRPPRSRDAEPWWQAWLWPSPRFYAGIAAVWAVILTLNVLTADRPGGPTRAAAPSSAETRRAFAEQRRELAELLGLAVTPVRTLKPAVAPPQSYIRRPGERVPDTTFTPIAPPLCCV